MSSLKTDKTPAQWRSLAELDNDPEFQKALENEFPSMLDDGAPTAGERRRFMQIMGASVAFATGCRWEQDKLLPLSTREDGTVPGVAKFFATAMDFGGVGYALRVKSYDGRPIKVDGHTANSDSLGATAVQAVASPLGLYDPDRSASPSLKGTASTWEEAEAALAKLVEGAAANPGGFAILSPLSSSPTQARLRAKLLEKYSGATWYEYSPICDENERKGTAIAFGESLRPRYDLEKADIVVSLDSDILSEGAQALRLSREFGERRKPESGEMNRLYAIESSLTGTGMLADHRYGVPAISIKAIAASLDAALTKKFGGEAPAGSSAPDAAILKEEAVSKLLAAIVDDLSSAKGKAVVVAGRHQSAEVHAIAHRLNQLIGAVGITVEYLKTGVEASCHDDIAALSTAMAGGKVKQLVILGGNPVYDAPSDLGFADALSKVENSVHLSLYKDETSAECSWHINEAHFLEAWGDSVSFSGALLLSQPLIAPLYSGLSAIELLAKLLGERKSDGQSLVRATHAAKAASGSAWRKLVHDGGDASQHFEAAKVELNALNIKFSDAEKNGASAKNGEIEVVFHACPKVHDGQFANNGWLQELPEPAMKLTWDNAAFLSLATAQSLGIKNEEFLRVQIGEQTLEIPALISPGQATGSIKIHLGYGRRAAGRVGGSVANGAEAPVAGFNGYVLRSSKSMDIANGVSVQGIGGRHKLATTQDKHPIDKIGQETTDARIPAIVREANLDEWEHHPDFAKHRVHHPPLLSLWNEAVEYDGYKWGMTFDLNKCNGCNACVAACVSENNIPVVGKDRVLMGREMHWIRIDRYFIGGSEQPRAVTQPVNCQQCEHAPCEQVCPVGATMHTHEGLNDMVYNRCIGTRYCSNNCPYKVRRFNYFNMHEDMKDEKNQVKGMVFNPEVTVRSRGVMEKCSYCVQRIQDVKIQAKNAKRKITDGEITTACQDACPAGAIEFGDMNDNNSKVSKAKRSQRNYALLGELNVRPRTTYLARVRNPHRELG